MNIIALTICQFEKVSKSQTAFLDRISLHINKSVFGQQITVSCIKYKQLTRTAIKMSINFAESPINKISNENVAEREPTPTTDPTNVEKFAMISKRLSENIKKLEQNELNTPNLKKFTNFKLIKNNLINGEASSKRGQIASKLAARGNDSASPEERRIAQVNPLPVSNHQGDNLIKKKLFQLDTYQPQFETLKTTNLASNSGSLANCLKQIKEVKQTIKNIKERCQNGHIEHLQKQRAEIHYHTNSSRKKYLINSGQKYMSNSGEKYSYTNYHDLSQRKLTELSQRKKKSQKSFNWIRNPVPVKEFTICTAEEPAQYQIQ